MRYTCFNILFIAFLFSFLLWQAGTRFFSFPVGTTEDLKTELPVAYTNHLWQDRIHYINTVLENDLKTSFPFYRFLIAKSAQTQEMLNTWLYQKMSISDFIPLDSSEKYCFENREKDTIIRLYPYPKSYYENGVKKSTLFYSSLAHRYPEISFHIFSITSLSVKGDIAENLQVKAAKKAHNDFIQNLSKQVTFSELPIRSFAEYQQYFFRSDHHWNMHGAYAGYCAALANLKQTDPTLPDPISISYRKVPNVLFHGSLSRVTLQPKIGDVLQDYYADLPPYSIHLNGKSVFAENSSIVSKKELYEKGQYDKNLYANHYAYYFHGDAGEIQYHFENNASKNLLVFCDSMSNCMEPLLASHYRETYFVDLRYYEEQTGKKFDFRSYINDHHIDTVLFFNIANTAMFAVQSDQGSWK